MSYVDLLDSSKTAYPNEFATEWWRKSSKEIQDNAISLANTELMLRILHGETILLSNNQAFDSVAFLRAVPELTRMESLDRPPVALSYFKPGVATPKEYAPEVLVDLSVDYLAKEVFVFSAWVGMDDNTPIRDRMSNGLKENDDSRKFISMVEDVYFDLDSSVRDDFRKQARSLQDFYDYLRKLHSLKKRVVRVAGKSDRLIWNDLDDLRYSPSKGIPSEAITILDEKLFTEKLYGSREDRSVLYRLIEDFGSPLRDDLKKYIDIFYNQKLGKSVSPRGRGTYSVMDHNPNTPSFLEEQILENAETINSMDGIVGEEALEIVPNDLLSLSTLTWDDVVRIMNDEVEIRESAYELQDNLALYKQLNPSAPDFDKKLDEWKKVSNASLESHQSLLSSALGEKIKYDGKTKRMFLTIAPYVGGAIGGAVAGTTVAVLFQNTVLGIAAGSATSEVLKDLISSWSTNSTENKLESSAITRVREDLRRSVKLPNHQE